MTARESRILTRTFAEPFDWAAWEADFDAKMARFRETMERHRAEINAFAQGAKP
jgi:hypothetical protein